MARRFFAATAPERDNHLWLDHCNLAHEKWRAGVALIAFGRAIAGRAAFHDVRDVDLFAAQSHGLDHVVEQLSGAPDERLSLRIFIRARAFADEHQVRMRIADAEDDLLAPLLVKLAAGAIAEIFADQLEGGYRISDALLRLRSAGLRKCCDRRVLQPLRIFLGDISSRNSGWELDVASGSTSVVMDSDAAWFRSRR